MAFKLHLRVTFIVLLVIQDQGANFKVNVLLILLVLRFEKRLAVFNIIQSLCDGPIKQLLISFISVHTRQMIKHRHPSRVVLAHLLQAR
jgi:hypothetical protein